MDAERGDPAERPALRTGIMELDPPGSNSKLFQAVMPTVSFRTLGCKLNQAETDDLAGRFLRRGWAVAGPGEAADVAVIHTCTVTGRSDAKCRQAVTHALRLNPGAVIVAAGCYAQVSAAELAAIPGVDYVVGTADKFRLPDLIEGTAKRRVPLIAVSDPAARAAGCAEETAGTAPEPLAGGRTRAFLKVQSGCDRHCAYCVVPAARGPGRSEPPGAVIPNAEALTRRGFMEIVVTGTHIGDYGKDFPAGKPDFPELLDRLARADGMGRIRLTSLDPDECTEALLDTVARHGRICRHFHVSLQSGSDAVLRMMNRRYDTETFAARVRSIGDRMDFFGLGTDVITGFPGETETHFMETVRFIESLPFTYLHVFPFSPRRNTAASGMPGPVPAGVRIERARILREVGERKRRAFAERCVGRTVEVLFEPGGRNGFLSGFSSEYVRVEAAAARDRINRLVPVRVTARTAGGGVVGEALP
ncbi:MAG: tRNA (N(6)-L-threonylcarbamoyladenosine(37)-C(2))-methylthiotransferase MtaB [bacterium]|nr:tRNA (N(6)-L-threonylcarbamoyladenosine(37)-C(2))-methylthiotransferase MtaB [bacterium]